MVPRSPVRARLQAAGAPHPCDTAVIRARQSRRLPGVMPGARLRPGDRARRRHAKRGSRGRGRLLGGAQPADAIFATLDILAVGAAIAARGVGPAGPPRGWNPRPSPTARSSARSSPTITALDLHAKAIGYGAVDLLLTLVEGGEDTEPEEDASLLTVEVVRGVVEGGARSR